MGYSTPPAPRYNPGGLDEAAGGAAAVQQEVSSDLWTRLMTGEVTAEDFLQDYHLLRSELEDKIAAVESKRTECGGETDIGLEQTVSSLSLAEEPAVKEGSGSVLEFLARNIQEKESELE